jgi:hypothetical protein
MVEPEDGWSLWMVEYVGTSRKRNNTSRCLDSQLHGDRNTCAWDLSTLYPIDHFICLFVFFTTSFIKQGMGTHTRETERGGSHESRASLGYPTQRKPKQGVKQPP